MDDGMKKLLEEIVENKLRELFSNGEIGNQPINSRISENNQPGTSGLSSAKKEENDKKVNQNQRPNVIRTNQEVTFNNNNPNDNLNLKLGLAISKIENQLNSCENAHGNYNDYNGFYGEYYDDGDDDTFLQLALQISQVEHDLGSEIDQALLASDSQNEVRNISDEVTNDNRLIEINQLQNSSNVQCEITDENNENINVNDFFEEQLIEPQENNEFECKICFETYLKSDAAVFDCMHLFCQECIGEHLTSLIKEHRIDELKCPEPNCNKMASEDLISQVLPLRMAQELENIRLRNYLRKNDDIQFCPKCQQPVVCDIDIGLGDCQCGFTFCTSCLLEYHGGYDCGLTDEERAELITAFKRQESEKEITERIERQRQKRLQEDRDSENTIRVTCKKCPNCRADIEKNDGCNHMTCSKCKCEFCWLCLTVFYGDYKPHFNQRCQLFYVPNEN